MRIERLTGLAVLLGIILLWQLVVESGLMSANQVPPPTDIASALVRETRRRGTGAAGADHHAPARDRLSAGRRDRGSARLRARPLETPACGIRAADRVRAPDAGGRHPADRHLRARAGQPHGLLGDCLRVRLDRAAARHGRHPRRRSRAAGHRARVSHLGLAPVRHHHPAGGGAAHLHGVARRPRHRRDRHRGDRADFGISAGDSAPISGCSRARSRCRNPTPASCSPGSSATRSDKASWRSSAVSWHGIMATQLDKRTVASLVPAPLWRGPIIGRDAAARLASASGGTSWRGRGFGDC